MARPKIDPLQATEIPVPIQEKDRRLIELIRRKTESDPEKLEAALTERIKELNCMYGMAQLAERHSDSLDEFLRDLVEIIPPSWQYPEITCARITFRGEVYKSMGFSTSPWRQSALIEIYSEHAGEVEVFYLEERPAEDEGPFLWEECLLIGAIAEQIGKSAVRISAEAELKELNRQLIVERGALQESNAALRAVMSRIEEEKNDIRKDIVANVDKIIMPILNALSLELMGSHKQYVTLLRTNLEEITSPFVNRLSRSFLALTPTEIKICKMIRNGMRTKEIARIQCVSTATINRHREHIRHKLDIANKDINLTTYLQSSAWDDMPERLNHT